MSPKNKYQIFTGVTILLFVYVLTTEIIDRWSEPVRLYYMMEQKEQSVLNPQALAEKRMNLLARKRQLGTMLTNGTKQYEQSETGVFEYLNASAKQAGIRFESLTPAESQTSGQIKEIGFKLQSTTDFHRVGTFLNAMETGVLLSCVNRVDIRSQNAMSSLLQVSVEGAAYVLPSEFK